MSTFGAYRRNSRGAVAARLVTTTTASSASRTPTRASRTWPSACAWKVKLSCDGRVAYGFPRGRLGARERDDLQGLRECDVREDLPLVPCARARARVLGVPMAGLRVGRVPARRTAGDNHPVGGAAYRRDLVRRSVPHSHHVNVSRHPRKVAARPAWGAAPRGVSQERRAVSNAVRLSRHSVDLRVWCYDTDAQTTA